MYLENKSYPLEMAGSRVGWTYVSQKDVDRTTANIVVASVSDEGSRYGYNTYFDLLLNKTAYPHDEGFIAVSALSVELSKSSKIEEKYLSSFDDVDEITSLLHNGATPSPIKDDAKKWASSGLELLGGLKAGLEEAGLSSHYPAIYYALNLSIGLDEKLEACSSGLETKCLLPADLTMRPQTLKELNDAQRMAGIISAILQIDEDTITDLSTHPGELSVSAVHNYLKAKYHVSTLEQEILYVVSNMNASKYIFNDPYIVHRFTLSDLRHNNAMPTINCYEAQRLKNTDAKEVIPILETAVKEVSDRLKAIERGVAVLGALKQAEESLVRTSFVKQKQFALEL